MSQIFQGNFAKSIIMILLQNHARFTVIYVYNFHLVFSGIDLEVTLNNLMVKRL